MVNQTRSKPFDCGRRLLATYFLHIDWQLMKIKFIRIDAETNFVKTQRGKRMGQPNLNGTNKRQMNAMKFSNIACFETIHRSTTTSQDISWVPNGERDVINCRQLINNGHSLSYGSTFLIQFCNATHLTHIKVI